MRHRPPATALSRSVTGDWLPGRFPGSGPRRVSPRRSLRSTASEARGAHHSGGTAGDSHPSSLLPHLAWAPGRFRQRRCARGARESSAIGLAGIGARGVGPARGERGRAHARPPLGLPRLPLCPSPVQSAGPCANPASAKGRRCGPRAAQFARTAPLSRRLAGPLTRVRPARVDFALRLRRWPSSFITLLAALACGRKWRVSCFAPRASAHSRSRPRLRSSPPPASPARSA